MAGRRKGRDAASRRKRAEQAVDHLASLIDSSNHSNQTLGDSAARDLLRTTKRHGVGAPADLRSKICRTCQQTLVPGRNARVRIESRVRKTTCLDCGRVIRTKLTVEGE